MYYWPVQALEASNVGSQRLEGFTATDLLVTSASNEKSMESHEWHLEHLKAISSDSAIRGPNGICLNMVLWQDLCSPVMLYPDHACSIFRFLTFEFAEFFGWIRNMKNLPAASWSALARSPMPLIGQS